MLDQGFTPEAIANSLGIDESTIFRYQKAFKESGLDSYLGNRYVAYGGKLTLEQEDHLKQELTDKLGFVFMKTTAVPSKGDAEAQRKFLEAFQALMAGLSPE
ncbi:helix-turn-helix domain-containing protein, partial [Arthrospira platensis SPKY1]|nr:helix-turn-helix domain-containing protein [Arthrospira platensis SPKY1]